MAIRSIATLSLTFLVVGIGGSVEPLQEALTSEDECVVRDDCAVHALQHKASKAQTDSSHDLDTTEDGLNDDELDEQSYRVDIDAELRSEWGTPLDIHNADPATMKLVAEFNRRFNSEDSGVFQRLVYGANPRPWINKGDTISFALMNKASWNPVKQQITIFDFHGAASGFIAKSSGIEKPGMLKCMFPCDGYSDHRKVGDNKGCGCGDTDNMKDFPCVQAGQADWCDYFGNLDTNFSFRATGTPCAFKPGQSKEMLKYYAEVKQDKAPGALQKSCNAWGQGADGSAAWNEAVVDGDAWRKDGRELIDAIVVPSTCYKSIICRNDLGAWYGRFKLWNGGRPMVYLDLNQHESPYQLLCDGTYCRLPTDEPWPSKEDLKAEETQMESTIAALKAAGNKDAVKVLEEKLANYKAYTA